MIDPRTAILLLLLLRLLRILPCTEYIQAFPEPSQPDITVLLIRALLVRLIHVFINDKVLVLDLSLTWGFREGVTLLGKLDVSASFLLKFAVEVD